MDRNRPNRPFPNERRRHNNEQQYLEETSSEFTNADELIQTEKDEDLKNVYGWIAFALSVLSFFVVPYLFAALAIIFGFVARFRDAQILGNTAIVIAVISIIFRLFLFPLI